MERGQERFVVAASFVPSRVISRHLFLCVFIHLLCFLLSGRLWGVRYRAIEMGYFYKLPSGAHTLRAPRSHFPSLLIVCHLGR